MFSVTIKGTIQLIFFCTNSADVLPDLCESRGLQQLLRRAGPINTDGAQQHHAAVHLVPGLQWAVKIKEDIVITLNSNAN